MLSIAAAKTDLGFVQMVGAIYWFVYLRGTDEVASATPVPADDA
jgi:hypothetical protein